MRYSFWQLLATTWREFTMEILGRRICEDFVFNLKLADPAKPGLNHYLSACKVRVLLFDLHNSHQFWDIVM